MIEGRIYQRGNYWPQVAELERTIRRALLEVEMIGALAIENPDSTSPSLGFDKYEKDRDVAKAALERMLNQLR